MREKAENQIFLGKPHEKPRNQPTFPPINHDPPPPFNCIFPLINLKLVNFTNRAHFPQ